MHSLPPCSFQEKIDWVRLGRSPTIGPITFWKMLRIHKTATQVLDFLQTQGKPVYCAQKVIEERQACLKQGIQFVFYGEENYPKNLIPLEDAPPVLQVKGSLNVNKSPCIALVGARNASIQGKRFAEKLANDLGKQGIIVVSGLARGIDTAVHQASLKTGTVAVLAGGIDQIYPTENEKLYDSIGKQGLLISEIALGTAPLATHFPRRNRLISGMCFGIVVIEAGLNSGSLITADFALQQGRDIFAVPGFPTDPHSLGTNKLLKQGAILVESAADILQELSGIQSEQTLFSDCSSLPPQENLTSYILSCLKNTPTDIDQIIQEVNKKPTAVLKVIGQLELEGSIIRHLGNKISLNVSS